MFSELSGILLVGLLAGVGGVLVAVLMTLLWIARTAVPLHRVVGLELLAGLTTALFVSLGVWQLSPFFLEVSLLVALLGYITTLAYARMSRREGER